MLILLSPTKTMKTSGIHAAAAVPRFLEETKKILTALQQLSLEELASLMKIKEALALENQKRFSSMRFDQMGTCALEAYDGLQYKTIEAGTLKEKEWQYLQEHLRILSGFYGVVKPLDSIYPYRLEMQTKLQVEGAAHLYAFWGNRLAQSCLEELKGHKSQLLLNLSSKEYEKAIAPYVKKEMLVQVIFRIEKEGKLKTGSTQAKQARGAMLRYLADIQAETLEDVKGFDRNGYLYEEGLSTQRELVFVKHEK